MARRIIDLSIAIENDVISDPAPMRPQVQYFAHDQTAEQMATYFPDLPDGEGWAVEQVSLSTHNGTHLDAPYHFASTMDGGKRAITIDEVPLEWCMGQG